MATAWYVAKDNQKLGPFSLAQLQQLLASGKLLPTDMVLQSDSRTWTKAQSVPGLIPVASFIREEPPASADSPPAVVSAGPGITSLRMRLLTAYHRHKLVCIGVGVAGLVIAIVLLSVSAIAVAALLWPSRTRHENQPPQPIEVALSPQDQPAAAEQTIDTQQSQNDGHAKQKQQSKRKKEEQSKLEKVEQQQPTQEKPAQETRPDSAKTDQSSTAEAAVASNKSTPENLRDAVSKAGFSTADLSLLAAHLPDFVRFGSSKITDEYARADQFDRIAIKEKMAQYRDTLRSRRFRLDKLKFHPAAREDVDTKGVLADLSLPFRVRGRDPFYKNLTAFSGVLRVIHPSEISPNSFGFLTNQGKLAKCNAIEAEIVEKSRGVLYYEEVPNTTLVLNFKDTLDTLKDISRNWQKYSVEVDISEMIWIRPFAWGYYKSTSWRQADGDCQKLALDSLLDANNPQPLYFATALGKENEQAIPELVFCQLDRLAVIDSDGKVIGGYRVDR